MHPAPANLVIVAWKSPLLAIVSVTGSFTDNDPVCGNGILWFIEKGGSRLASGNIPNGGAQGFSLPSVSVSPGQILYFMVDANKGDFGCDSNRARFDYCSSNLNRDESRSFFEALVSAVPCDYQPLIQCPHKSMSREDRRRWHGEDQSVAGSGDEDSDNCLAARSMRERASNSHPLQKAQRIGHPTAWRQEGRPPASASPVAGPGGAPFAWRFSFGGWTSELESLWVILHPGVYLRQPSAFRVACWRDPQHRPQKFLFLRIVRIGLRGWRE